LLAAVTNVAFVVAASAEPAAPDVDPVHGQREDAQRLAQQHHDLIAAPPPALPAHPAQVEMVETKKGQRIAGLALLSVGGLVALVALPVALTSSESAMSGSTSQTTSTLLVISGAASAVLGGLLIYNSRSVSAAPTVGSHAVGVAISGRL
jgi:hypothetical protein